MNRVKSTDCSVIDGPRYRFITLYIMCAVHWGKGGQYVGELFGVHWVWGYLEYTGGERGEGGAVSWRAITVLCGGYPEHTGRKP